MIYKERVKESRVKCINDDFRNCIDVAPDKTVVVTDPPFNIGYHYGQYNDRISENDYFSMLSDIVKRFPSVIIHYPESLHKLSIYAGVAPDKVAAWVYNSNTAKQHRDIAWYNIKPDFTNAWQEYKNPTDKRIIERIKNGSRGGRMYDWWQVNQVKNTSKEKTSHPCQMPLEVMKNIISTLPDDCVVFDPFMGSGTTGVACVELGYDFIGCEIDRQYCEIAKNRISEGEQE